MSLSMIFSNISRLILIGCLTLPADAAEPLLRPYILSSNVQGDMVKAVIELKEALTAGGFQLLGEYSPDADRHVIVVTNDYLQRLAAEEESALFSVPQRIGITRFEGRLQVAYTNPIYQKYAFRITGDLEPVRLQLKSILGEQETFGSSAGLTAEALSGYRHARGMEQFDNFLYLGKFASQARALKVIAEGLRSGQGGVSAVFRIDIPESVATLFGVALKEGAGSDQTIIDAVDIRPLKHTPRFPSTLVVRGGEVFALHPRFKLALDFPDLERTGKYSFTRLIRAPGGIEESLHALLYGRGRGPGGGTR